MIKYAKKGDLLSVFPMGDIPKDWEELTEQEFEQLKAPTEDEQALETLQKEQTDFDSQIAELKDNLLTATLADNQEEIEAIKAHYQTLVGGN